MVVRMGWGVEGWGVEHSWGLRGRLLLVSVYSEWSFIFGMMRGAVLQISGASVWILCC